MYNILITGASKGIGKVIAEELRQVANVYVTGRNEDALKSFENYCVCDLASDIEVLEEYIRKNNIDILINNAGEYVYGSIDEVSVEQIEHIFKVNVLAPIRLISAASVNMKEKKWGRVVNIGSISGVMGEANASLYSSTKSALIGLTKALALELAEYNITVNVINPGWVETDMGNSSCGEFSKDELVECIPQRRFVAPDEVAGMVEYLISDKAKGVTGQSINLCAGLSVGI
jgi:NAD(P)-dependent dehydrogenase (short-subunit alcohol dehydrogenase family)